MQPAVRPRPRGQARGHEPAREDAGAPLKRHWLVLILKDHQPTAKFRRRDAARRDEQLLLIEIGVMTRIMMKACPQSCGTRDCRNLCTAHHPQKSEPPNGNWPETASAFCLSA